MAVADGNHFGHDHDHGYDHDLPRLSRDYGERDVRRLESAGFGSTGPAG